MNGMPCITELIFLSYRLGKVLYSKKKSINEIIPLGFCMWLPSIVFYTIKRSEIYNLLRFKT